MVGCIIRRHGAKVSGIRRLSILGMRKKGGGGEERERRGSDGGWKDGVEGVQGSLKHPVA